MAEYIRQDHHLPHGSLEPHITNGDRIRQMTDEELANFLCYLQIAYDLQNPLMMLEWLRKEAEDG